MIASLEQRVADFFGPLSGVVAAYLFGSVARGVDRPDSDIDVAVLFDESPALTLDSPVSASRETSKSCWAVRST